MTINSKLENFITKYKDVINVTETDELIRVKVNNKINEVDLVSFVNELYDIENEVVDKNEKNIGLDLKGLDLKYIEEIVKLSLKREDLVDPLMILNITNFIKIYNTLNSSFFENQDVYISELSDLLDLRLDLQEELEDFVQQLSIYFISLFKSYNKLTYAPNDIHKPLPKVFKAIFLTSNFLTLSGIFASSKPFSTEQCIYLDDALDCIYSLETKSGLEFKFINLTLKGLTDGTRS